MTEPRPNEPPSPGAPRATPGEVKPEASGRLAQPPALRYAQADAARAAARPRWTRAAVYGLLAAAGGAAVWLVAAGLVGLSGGLLVLAIVLAWGIGTAIRVGAWGSAKHPADGRTGVRAIVLGVSTWLAGTFLVYVYSLATRPDSALSLADRLAGTPFLDW
ncbi:MAG: hypothetical protein ACXWN5_04785, partial [Candidatus Limnocylindrales bacterium]